MTETTTPPPNDEQGPAETFDASKKKPRIFYLLIALAVLVVLTFLNRSWLASLPNGQARQSLSDRDLEGAQWWLDVALTLSPNNVESLFLKSRVLRRQDDIEGAAKLLDQAEEMGASAELLSLERWLLQTRAGEVAATEVQLTQLLAKFPWEGEEICAAYVRGAMHQHDYNLSYQALEKWLQLAPDDPTPYMLRGTMWSKAHRSRDAEKDFRRVLEMDPNQYQAAMALGDLFLRENRPADAHEQYIYAARDESQRALVKIRQARCLRELGKLDAAREQLTEFADQESPPVEAELELARIALESAEFEQALARLEPLAQRAPKNFEVQYALGRALRGIGQTEKAKRIFDSVAIFKGKLTRASNLIANVLKSPDDLASRHEIGLIYLNYGDEQDGLSWLESVLLLDPNHAATLCVLAEYFSANATAKPEFTEKARMYQIRCQMALRNAGQPARTHAQDQLTK